MTHVKQKIETGMLIGGKLMVDVMRSTRASRRLAGLRAHTNGGSSSGAGNKVTNAPIMVEKEWLANEVYIPYWNLSKTSRLTSVDEKRE